MLAVLKPTAVNSVLAEVRALQAEAGKLVSLMRGEPDFATPATSQKRPSAPCNRAARRTRTIAARSALRNAVAEKLQRVDGVSYDPASEILITDGATLGVYAALMALLSPGDEILLPDPIYDAYQSPIRLAGGRAIPVKSNLRNGRFALTVEALEAAVHANHARAPAQHAMESSRHRLHAKLN